MAAINAASLTLVTAPASFATRTVKFTEGSSLRPSLVSRRCVVVRAAKKDDDLKEGAQQLRESFIKGPGTTKENVSNTADQVKEGASDAAGQVQDAASDATKNVQDAVTNASRQVQEAVDNVTESAKKLGEQVKDAVNKS